MNGYKSCGNPDCRSVMCVGSTPATGRTEAVIAAARAATIEWDALRAKMTREPFMPRTTRDALDALAAAVAELDKAGRS